MIKRVSLGLFVLVLGAATPALAGHPEGSPLNPRPNNRWIKLGHFTGPLGGADGYTNLADKDMQPAAIRAADQYLVTLWMVLDRPSDTPQGTVTEEEFRDVRLDCPFRSIGDDGSVYEYGPDGSVVSSYDPGTQTYSLEKAEGDNAPTHLLEAFCG